MNSINKDIKILLLQKCKEYVANRIANAENALADAREAAGSETKSSAGDKHETGRAMMQLEQEKHSKMLAEARQLESVLDRISSDRTSPVVALGSVVYTSAGNFYISVSAGKLMVNDATFFAVSIRSPIAQCLAGNRKGDKLAFNNQLITILELF